MTATVGADIESICRKCGDVWHVIVAMVEDDIAKVQCKQCNGLHRYKAPAEAGAAGAAKAKKPAKKRAPAMTAAEKKAAAAAKPKGRATAKADLSKPTRPYKFSESYESGERIDHVKFGVGIVEDVLDGSKIEVYFPDGRRVLAVAKRESALATLKAHRPAWLAELKSAKAE